ncbi:hypothetical protein KL86APRO_10469 [uncultured Alphaproteobacteria bacterium]|uniref:Uncharacterized protein n=1 Tax=uncultured Alphaproteobacteria bacterium TaxID=91750 RepID=A0A212J3R6_9PROT|nr:hypothetical protein KL86APRO_10469 [uncultured Alphaproteobacteria bacterium]
MTKITLSKPLPWGNEEISEIVLRRPTAGDLRGIKLTGIAEMDVNTVMVLLPRISVTPLAKSVLNELDPADVVEVCSALSVFFEASPNASPKTPSMPGA